MLAQELQAFTCQFAAAFNGLIGIAYAGKKCRAGFSLSLQFFFENIDDIGFDFNEVTPSASLIMMGILAHESGIAVPAAVGAANVWIDRICDTLDFGSGQGGLGRCFGYSGRAHVT